MYFWHLEGSSKGMNLRAAWTSHQDPTTVPTEKEWVVPVLPAVMKTVEMHGYLRLLNYFLFLFCFCHLFQAKPLLTPSLPLWEENILGILNMTEYRSKTSGAFLVLLIKHKVKESDGAWGVARWQSTSLTSPRPRWVR